jgi:hypothetical protein
MEDLDHHELQDYFTEHDLNLASNQTFQLEIHLANGTFHSNFFRLFGPNYFN